MNSLYTVTENRPTVIQIVDFVCDAVFYNLKVKDWIIGYVFNVLIGEEYGLYW